VRYKECIDKINSGSVYAIAVALRDLHLAKSDKAWSISEKKMMGTAQNHLVQELAIVDQTDEFLVKQQIEQIFI
jgi:RNA polymerase-interacting CarD/CdnL/TRCF family regulator